MPAEPERDLSRLLAEESFVRELARQLVAGDADEVVQQTWLRAVQKGGHGVEQPRHWLARVLRNVAANLRRDERRRSDRERAAAPPRLVPSSAELAEREERRRELVAAVDALPVALRTVVLLRWFDGQPPRRIGKALGLPAATVSAQLHRALALLRTRLDQAHGGNRRAWVAPLLPFAMRPELPPAAPFAPVPAAAKAFFLGAIAMTTKSKFALCAGVLAVVAAALCWEGLVPPGTPDPEAPGASLPALVQAPLGKPVEVSPATTMEVEREAATPKAAVPTTGTVVVHVRHAGDRTPAAGRMLLLARAGADRRFDARRLRTDAAGTAQYDDVQPGRFVVSCEPSGAGRAFDVVAGETATVELQLEPGLTVTGIVVTRERVPVAGAQVELTEMARSDSVPEVVAVTGADGRFEARTGPVVALVGARAPGHVASAVRFLHGKKGNTAEVELVLGPDGGMLDGTVVDARGEPVAEAVVIVGTGEVSSIGGRDHIPPFAALVRSDAAGRFRAVGLAAGKQPIRVRAQGFAPWQGSCDIIAGATATQRVELAPGGTVRGTVTNADGKVVARASVQIGERRDSLSHFGTQSNADGAFELGGLPLGEIRLRCAHDDFGKAETMVRTTAEGAVVCDLQLSRGLVLHGHVVDPDGQPVPGATLECRGEVAAAREWGLFTRTDAKGQFAVANCPEQGTIRIAVHATGFAVLEQPGIDPKTADLELRLQRVAARTVRILGTLVGADGRPLANAHVEGVPAGASASTGHVTDNAGRFALGPVSPDSWRVRISSRDHAEFTTEERQLGPDATWDLGTITLPRGGRARMRLVGPPRDGAWFGVIDAARNVRMWTLSDEADGRRTSALASGDYLLLVSGKGVAAQALPFTIREGEEVVVDVELQEGIAQRFVCDVPAGTDVPGATVWIQRGDAPVARKWVSFTSNEPAMAWLAPGDYTAVAEAGALRGSTAFTVGTVSGEVRITLR